MTKKISLIVFAIACFINAYSQSSPITTPVKSIHVTGSAEREIIPDEIYVSIILQEYMNDRTKVEISTLENQLKAAVTAAGLEIKDLQIENVWGSGWIKKKRRQTDYLDKKTYILKVAHPSKIDLVTDKLDVKGIQDVSIHHYDHSKMTEYRKELKIQAIKNAKEKAEYLLEAIGEKMGGAITVTENASEGLFIDESAISNNEYRHYSNSLSKNYDYNNLPSEITFKTIKIRYEIAVQFAIK